MSEYESINEQIKFLEEKAEKMIYESKNEAVTTIKSMMESYGITFDDLSASITKLMRKAPIKYRGHNGESWSGRGLTPKWMCLLMAKGYSKKDFAV